MTPKIRQSFYYFSTIVSGVIGLGLLYGGLSAGLANHITEVIAGVGGLLGATGPALAGKKLGEQVKDGTFESLDPAAQVSQGVQAAREQYASAVAQAEAIKAAVSGVVDDIPVVGPLAADALDKIRF